LREDVTSPYKLEFTEAEKQALFEYSADSNSFQINIGVRTNTNAGWSSKLGTAYITNANPIFNNFTYEDTNIKTKSLTGNNQIIIKNYSDLRATISLSNKAIAQKGATMSNYQLVVGAKQITMPYSATEPVIMNIEKVDNNVFTVYAIDSRKNSTLKQISPSNYINYFKPVLSNVYAERTGGIDDETTLFLEGSFFNENFGSVANDITLSYKYKKTDEDDSKWQNGTTPITPIKNGNNFSFAGKIAGDKGALGFDAGNSYDIIVEVNDELDSDSFSLILGTGEPNIAIHKNGTAIGMPFDETQGKSFQVAGKKILFNGITLFEWVEEE